MNVTTVVDKDLVRLRIARAMLRRVPGAGFLLDRVVADLGERLAGVERHFGTAVALGGHTAATEAMLSESGKADRMVRFDLAPGGFEAAGSGAVADEEALPLGPESIDLFVSALALQWTNDLPGALMQIRQSLRPDGLLLAAFAGGSTLHELRDVMVAAETDVTGGASPRVLPFADLRDIGALLQRAGFALPVVDRDVLTVRYDTAFNLFADLRAMGAANALTERTRRPGTRMLFRRAAEIYAERHADPDGRIRATFEIISLSGWAPHESQQKPARRGSATVSLASVLGKKE